MQLDCFECGVTIDATELEALGDRFLAHARNQHEWPYSDHAIRNYAEATQRLTGSAERIDQIGPISIAEVTAERIGDWLAFFDHDAFVGTPEWAACYCLEPHVRDPDAQTGGDHDPRWQENRSAMIERLENGDSFGYLAYIDGKAGGWVNASKRSQYALYRDVDPSGPHPWAVIGVSCFIIAPPYRRHGVAQALLDRVIEDAPARGASWIEAYPRNAIEESDSGNFRGPRSMYEERGFEPVEVRQRDTVMRRRVPTESG